MRTFLSIVAAALLFTGAAQASYVPAVPTPPSVATRAPAVNDDALVGYRSPGSVYLSVSAGGSGYTSATVAISAPTGAGGVQATAQPVITGGVITGFIMTNPGSGYSTAVNNGVTATISGTGTGATAAINVALFPSLWRNGNEWFQAVSTTPGKARWSRLAPLQALPCDISQCFAAYGTKLLTRTYTAGSAIDVINPTGGATVTIAFNSLGQIDANTISNLCGSTGCRVSKVYDQGTCGTACDATQATSANQPIIQALQTTGGVPDIVFDDGLMNPPADGHLSYMTLPAAVTLGANASAGLLLTRFNNNLGTANTANLISLTGGSTALTYGQLSGNVLGTNYGLALGTQIPALNATTGGWAFSSSYSFNFYGDKVAQGSGKGASTEAGGYLGAASASVYASFSAAMVWNTATSQATLLAAQIALNQLYGTTPQAKSIIVGDGDSITFGQSSTAGVNYTRQLEALLNKPALIYNSGSPGQTLNAGLTQFYVGNYYNPQSPVVIDNLWYGTNDLNNSGSTTAASLFAQEQQYCVKVHALGPNAKIVGITMLPRNTNTAAQETVRTAFNALMVANAGACTFDAIADVGSDPTLGTVATASAGVLTTGVHPYTPGYAYVAQIIAAADNQLLAAASN